MNSQIQPLVKQEIAGLRRIANYEGYSAKAFDSGMWELEKFFAITLDDDKLNGEIDFYSQHQPNDPSWDTDSWDAEKLRLRFNPSRQNFLACHRMIRCLLGGRTLTFTDGSQLSRQSHLNEVREHGIRNGIDLSFEEYSGQVTSSVKGGTV